VTRPSGAVDVIELFIDAWRRNDRAMITQVVHPYIRWMDARGKQHRGRNQILEWLGQRREQLQLPAGMELRDGQIYRWEEPRRS